MSVQSETQLKSDDGTMYYQLQDIPLKISFACRRNSVLGDCVVTSEFGELCERLIHTSGSQRTQEKLRKEIGGLEDWRKAYFVFIQSISNIEGLY